MTMKQHPCEGRTEAKVCKRIRLCLNDDPKNDMIITCLLTYQLPTVMLRNGSGVQWKSCPRFSDSLCVKAGAEESGGGGGGSGETNVCIDNFGVCLNNNNNNSVIGGSNDNTDNDYVECSNVEGNDGGVHKSGNNIGGRDIGEQSNGVVETDGRGVDGKEGNAVSSNNYSSEAMNTNNSAINCSASLNDDHILITKPTNTGNTSRTPSLIINPCLSPLRYKWIVPKHHMKHLSVVPAEGVLKPFEIKVNRLSSLQTYNYEGRPQCSNMSVIRKPSNHYTPHRSCSGFSKACFMRRLDVLWRWKYSL